MEKYYAYGLFCSEDTAASAVYRASEVDARIANTVATYSLRNADLEHRIAELEEALSDIEANCNGYGDIAGWACKRAAKALRPDSSL